jgi:hypothetical protein
MVAVATYQRRSSRQNYKTTTADSIILFRNYVPGDALSVYFVSTSSYL